MEHIEDIYIEINKIHIGGEDIDLLGIIRKVRGDILCDSKKLKELRDKYHGKK